MSLVPGARIGAYEVATLIGAGGMGEVYLARDVRLKRDVALKILPDRHRFDAQRLARFEREAQVLASLNHPNIATLYGVEASGDAQALVMEFVDGETLSERLAPGGLPLATVLPIARQIVDALDTAHEQGIVHRDLKPANIKIRPDGGVKVLDFGLAKALDFGLARALGADDAPARVDLTTLTAAEVTIVGTPAYMSPEQARGGAIDRRTDIWAFGCVLYEMLTGRRAFDGATTSDAIAAVLTREPDWAALPATVPPAVRRLLRRCLEKDTRHRLRDIGDAREDLHEQSSRESVLAARTELPAGGAGSSRDSIRRQRLWMAFAGVFGLTTLALLGVTVYERKSRVVPEPMRFVVYPPDKGIFQTPLGTGSAAPVGGTISPDGRTLAFTASDSSGATLLWIRPLGSLDARALPGTDGAALPFWSPDGKALGFFGRGKLKRIDVADGALQVLCDVVRGRGGSWNRDGDIIFAPALGSALSRVNAGGGEPQILTTLGQGQRSHRFPYFLPDGRHFLYYAEGSHIDDTGVFVGELNANSSRRVLAADSAAVYAPPGYLLFVRQGTLFAQAFDIARVQVVGDPVSLATSVPDEGTSPAFSVSDTGVLTYRSGPAEDQQFAWFDRTGRLLETVGPPGNYRGVDLSPDGKRIAVHRHDGDGGDIWVFDARGTTTRVTFDAAKDNASPIWSPDGTRIAFGSLRNGKWGLYEKRADATEADDLLVESEIPKVPAAWSPQGTSIVYWLFTNGIDSWLLDLTRDLQSAHVARGQSDSARESIPLISTRFYEGHAQVSPDGKWIAYSSTESGINQVHVRPFPSGEGIWQISTGGGVTPRWGRDGKELFYVTSYDDGKLMSVPVRGDAATFVTGTPHELFSVGMVTPPHSTAINTYHTYAVSPDSQRFLIPRPAPRLRDDTTPTPITVLLNWTAMLPR